MQPDSVGAAAANVGWYAVAFKSGNASFFLDRVVIIVVHSLLLLIFFVVHAMMLQLCTDVAVAIAAHVVAPLLLAFQRHSNNNNNISRKSRKFKLNTTTNAKYHLFLELREKSFCAFNQIV